MMTLMIYIKKMWLIWAGFFKYIPYGDPYVAFIILFVLAIGIVIVLMKLQWRHTSYKTMNTNTEADRMKTWCKVMNIY